MNLGQRYFISDPQLIKEVVSRLSETNSDSNLWTKTYLDPETGDQWIQYYVDGELHGGGYPVLAKIPLPDTIGIINIAILTENDDELFGACRTLTENEKINGTDFRINLIDRLEKLDNKKKINQIIKLTNLDSELNRRVIVDKSADQNYNDANYFKNIASRANRLK
jgi:hypothetical protein